MKTMKKIGLCAVGAMALTIVACGGSDGAAPTTPPSANRSPQFTSIAGTTVTENSTGSFYTATATDADGDTIAFSIVGGTDAAFFELTGAELSFIETPNFDRFADSNEDNIYNVTISASDGRGGTVERSISVTLENDVEGVSVRRIATGFNDPTSITDWIDGGAASDGFLLVAERGGKIWSLNSNTGERQIWRDLNLAPGRELIEIAGNGRGGIRASPIAIIRDNQGIYLAFPDFASIPELKIADGDPEGAGAALGYTINTELGGQGLLVVAIGDPGGQRAQGNSGYGNIYVVRDPSAFTTRNDLFELGRGVQQPSAIFDFIQGVLIADVGSSVEHELSPLVSRDLVNFGWPFFEGRVEIQAGAPTTLVPPSFVYAVGDGNLSGTAIRGGVYYDSTDRFENSRISSLNDRILFADKDGSIFTVGLDFDPASFENRTLDFLPDAGSLDSIVKVAENFQRVLYILDTDGEVFRADPS